MATPRRGAHTPAANANANTNAMVESVLWMELLGFNQLDPINVWPLLTPIIKSQSSIFNRVHVESMEVIGRYAPLAEKPC